MTRNALITRVTGSFFLLSFIPRRPVTRLSLCAQAAPNGNIPTWRPRYCRYYDDIFTSRYRLFHAYAFLFRLKTGDALARHYGNITMRLTRFCHADILMDNVKGRRYG
ncbi:hypothetical protein SNQ22_000704 [Cronobacter universalis]|nr:hypothetical protein [Cronobacter universalis]